MLVSSSSVKNIFPELKKFNLKHWWAFSSTIVTKTFFSPHWRLWCYTGWQEFTQRKLVTCPKLKGKHIFLLLCHAGEEGYGVHQLEVCLPQQQMEAGHAAGRGEFGKVCLFYALTILLTSKFSYLLLERFLLVWLFSSLSFPFLKSIQKY